MRISAIPARFKANFGLFRSPADTDRYNRYGPILAESARFGVNRRESKPNRRKLSRVGANLRKKKKKRSLDAALTREQPHRTRVQLPPSRVRAFQFIANRLASCQVGIGKCLMKCQAEIIVLENPKV